MKIHQSNEFNWLWRGNIFNSVQIKVFGRVPSCIYKHLCYSLLCFNPKEPVFGWNYTSFFFQTILMQLFMRQVYLLNQQFELGPRDGLAAQNAASELVNLDPFLWAW